jgi:hypothetical protein
MSTRRTRSRALVPEAVAPAGVSVIPAHPGIRRRACPGGGRRGADEPDRRPGRDRATRTPPIGWRPVARAPAAAIARRPMRRRAISRRSMRWRAISRRTMARRAMRRGPLPGRAVDRVAGPVPGARGPWPMGWMRRPVMRPVTDLRPATAAASDTPDKDPILVLGGDPGPRVKGCCRASPGDAGHGIRQDQADTEGNHQRLAHPAPPNLKPSAERGRGI